MDGSPDVAPNAGPRVAAGAPTTPGWCLYLVECGDGTWYAGITNDLDARLQAHREGRGARYTRGRGPLTLLATREYPDRATASRAEWRLKRLPRARKLAFFADGTA
jgi:putative endonuclease